MRGIDFETRRRGLDCSNWRTGLVDRPEDVLCLLRVAQHWSVLPVLGFIESFQLLWDHNGRSSVHPSTGLVDRVNNDHGSVGTSSEG